MLIINSVFLDHLEWCVRVVPCRRVLQERLSDFILVYDIFLTFQWKLLQKWIPLALFVHLEEHPRKCISLSHLIYVGISTVAMQAYSEAISTGHLYRFEILGIADDLPCPI